MSINIDSEVILDPDNIRSGSEKWYTLKYTVMVSHENGDKCKFVLSVDDNQPIWFLNENDEIAKKVFFEHDISSGANISLEDEVQLVADRVQISDGILIELSLEGTTPSGKKDTELCFIKLLP